MSETTQRKVKKPRWRDQAKNTVVVSQVPFDVDEGQLKTYLEKFGGVRDVRLAKGKERHAGLAYVVVEDAEKFVKRCDGKELEGRALRAAILKARDEKGRRVKHEKIGQAAQDLVKRSGLQLDERAVAALAKTSHPVASIVLKDVAKKPVRNVSAYAVGVLKRLRSEGVDETSRPQKSKKPKLLSQSDVDRLVPGDIDQRARDYLAEFSLDDARTAVHRLKSASTKKQASPSAFLMGILRDLSSSDTKETQNKRPPRKHFSAPGKTKHRPSSSSSSSGRRRRS